ncbi:MAG: hypothetical protein EA427_13555 [Spirochaetaceae bacterium]|nr:MAG: hypothetical protein EA427_13555 [Spirochaetaceae bacterium]
MNIAVINGSPRGESASSREVISILERLGGADLQWTGVSRLDLLPEDQLEQRVEELCRAPVLLVTAPLYIDGLPATTIRALERYRKACLHRYGKRDGHVPEGGRVPEGGHPVQTGGQRVFAVVNCGFYEGSQNRHALEMVEHFCRESGLTWCGGVGIGTGEMIRGLKEVPLRAGVRRPVVAALQRLVEAIGLPGGRLEENLYTQHRLPWWMYRLLGQLGWRRQARRNGVRRGALHDRPHGVV